ncbi:MAG TPA: hypothetical protein VG960_04090 [Caulobacteraceae bacterium]|nr:hypothetical protein [Caulobacteraceae bacterium]
MKTAHIEHAVRRSAGRLQGSASRLIEDGQGVVSAKLTEAADVIQGAFAHLLDESQDLIRAKMVEANEVLQHTRERAAHGAKDALDQAKDRAQDSYVVWDKMARKRPLATVAIAIAIGLAVGLALQRRKAQTAAPRKALSRTKPAEAVQPAAANQPKAAKASARKPRPARKSAAAKTAGPERPPITH